MIKIYKGAVYKSIHEDINMLLLCTNSCDGTTYFQSIEIYPKLAFRGFYFKTGFRLYNAGLFDFGKYKGLYRIKRNLPSFDSFLMLAIPHRLNEFNIIYGLVLEDYDGVYKKGHFTSARLDNATKLI